MTIILSISHRFELNHIAETSDDINYCNSSDNTAHNIVLYSKYGMGVLDDFLPDRLVAYSITEDKETTLKRNFSGFTNNISVANDILLYEPDDIGSPMGWVNPQKTLEFLFLL